MWQEDKGKSFICGVGREGDIIERVRPVISPLDRFDMLINNAAIPDNKTILDLTTEE
ncbi:MAG TPA: hypothetical protein VGJ20_29265 [Xanthobacteraceae bacterium]